MSKERSALNPIEAQPPKKRLNKTFIFYSSLVASGVLFTVALISRKSNPVVFKGAIAAGAVIIGAGNIYRAFKADPRNGNTPQNPSQAT